MKKYLLLVLCSLLLFTGCGHESYFQSTELIKEAEDTIEETSSDISDVVPQIIYVQVAGAVQKPGVYDLPFNSRVYAAIDAAGGLLDSADDSDINQAALLEDGQKIYVYSKEEKEELLLSEENAEDDGLININTATESELTSLPGIGQAKASQIISYRNANGDFSTIEDIKNVSGIGDGIFNQINSLIKI
ncbi:helix-hairpin-helix domain-containing protein [Pseudobutyrivibrio xylanivorans]|uniref:Competence protein ComEA n=1 Tax=Pseudobutyrivibrio xylanivorans DSM 14809 TaxID=1123012 RepID=A0A1M6EPV0_PSEXY|nr:helix-hairpin-helix domain-containing protein [Pseudobutyrivibrio xylanivorans]SHI87491.1 competence protein ComEA [Pseudobutyrivibrio xylanivorans DSM 14809]